MARCDEPCPYCKIKCWRLARHVGWHNTEHGPTCPVLGITTEGESPRVAVRSEELARLIENAAGPTSSGAWIQLAAAEIAGDPSVRDGGADRVADVIRGHIEAAAKKRGT